jgi:hypothetical protein
MATTMTTRRSRLRFFRAASLPVPSSAIQALKAFNNVGKGSAFLLLGIDERSGPPDQPGVLIRWVPCRAARPSSHATRHPTCSPASPCGSHPCAVRSLSATSHHPAVPEIPVLFVLGPVRDRPGDTAEILRLACPCSGRTTSIRTTFPIAYPSNNSKGRFGASLIRS